MVEPYSELRDEVQQTHTKNGLKSSDQRIIKIHAEDHDIQASIITEQTQYLQLSTASTAVYNGIRNILIGSSFLYGGIINLAFQTRFTELPPVAVYFFYLSTCTAISSVLVLISPAMWATLSNNPIQSQMSLLVRSKIIVPTGMGLIVVSFLSLLGVQTWLIFSSVAISVGVSVGLLGIILIFWFMIPYTVQTNQPTAEYKKYLYKQP